jgi:hypothetical protein
VPIALDVNGAWPDGNAEEIGVDGKETRVEVVERRSACRIADKLVVQMAMGPAFG